MLKDLPKFNRSPNQTLNITSHLPFKDLVNPQFKLVEYQVHGWYNNQC